MKGTECGSRRAAARLAAAACLVACGSAGHAHETGAPHEVPGFRPVSSHASQFVASLDTARLVVHPTIVRRAHRTAHSFKSRSQIIAALEAAGLTAISGNIRVELGRLVARSQWELFEADLQRIGETVSGRYPDAQYHLFLEFLLPVSIGEIFGIQCYIIDQQGNNAFSFLMNSHHRPFVDARLVASDSSEEALAEMTARATKTGVVALLAQIAVERGRAARAAARAAAIAAGDYSEAIFDDFETPVARTADSNGNALGFIAFTDGSSSAEFTVTTEYPVLPDEPPGNHVLRLDLDVGGWAGFAHFFYYRDKEAADWSPYDWRAFDGIGFWLYGQDSGTMFFVDIIDNRHPGSTRDDAERFVYTFMDDFAGWRRMSIPFEAFERKEVGNGAPNDGLGLASVHGWAIGTTATQGSRTYFIDDFSLQHVGPASHEQAATADTSDLPINELPMYGLREKTAAQKRADDEYIRTMTKGGRSREEAAEVAARNAWDIFYSGDKEAAIRRFNQAWLLDPDNQLALWGFAVTSVDRGDFETAAGFYRMAIERSLPNPGLERDYRLTLRQLDKLSTGGASR